MNEINNDQENINHKQRMPIENNLLTEDDYAMFHNGAPCHV